MPTDFFRRILSKKMYARVYRWGLNIWPCIRGGGGRVIHISEDFTLLTVRLALTWRSRNLVGTIFGGSMYASTDPMFMLMLIEILGPDFVVWDKGCAIRFKRPSKVPMFASFNITPEMIQDIRQTVARDHEYSFTWKVEYKDKQGTVYCEFDKVLYVAEKSFYKDKLKRRADKTN